MSYYEEKNRAIRHIDFIINEVLYVNNKSISIVELEINHAPKFNCAFMKVFYERLKLFMLRDGNIEHDVKNGVVRLKKDEVL